MNKKNELTHSQIQEELIELLKKTDEFLRKNEIEYTISYGTLLGAVRHKGFIPWDDDIDISMKRSEYNKFLSLLRKKNEIEEGISVEGICLNNNEIPFLKIVNNNIKVCEEINGGYNDDYLWIDVFPVDYVPNHFQKIFFAIIYKYYRKFYYFSRFYEKGWESHAKKCLANSILAKFAKRKNSSYYSRKLDEFSESIKESKFLANNVFGTSGEKELVDAKLFDSYIDYNFENIKVRGIKDYDTYLKVNYGNYMEIPPAEDRITHGLRAWKYEE
ncbi:LicD family protein [Anaerococcus sp. AGMB00486]|uniref:LicD family protein n=2 Tax=Anaerococcus TaxID=165779 RepID=A0ABX2N9I4_9FIRM|nr:MULTISPECIES: LicD family protein [Anaerococcus]MSS78504.1 LicD family protein [Anaerococcus porci]NVF11361.1 LicD family protein [Anaerococcus faecalis]